MEAAIGKEVGQAALTAETLVEQFGVDSDFGRDAIAQLDVAVGDVLSGDTDDERVVGDWGESGTGGAELEKLAARLGVAGGSFDARRFLFALQTYYWLVAQSIGRATPAEPLGDRDSFAWALTHKVGRRVAAAVREQLEIGGVATTSRPRDVLKSFYQQLIPRSVRHTQGEYYTPDWLAEHTLDRVDYQGQLDQRMLDPACGSGTFLVLAIERLRRRCAEEGLGAGETVATIVENVVGIDVNPLAVVAARANYRLALLDLIGDTSEIAVPIYLADSILDSVPIGQFDCIAGNPPWVGWESLAADYRATTQPLWQHYGLFPHGGMDTILGKGKKDLSMLMSYVVTDRFLRDDGVLGFVITQSMFKTSGASAGFRQFRIQGDAPLLHQETPLAVVGVDDFSDLQPFSNASTRASVFVWQKGRETSYPVLYDVWQQKRTRRTLAENSTLDDLYAVTRQLHHLARPVDPGDATAPWMTCDPGVADVVTRLVGASDYRAHEGVNTGGANGVFWLEVLDQRDGVSHVRNITAGAKRRVEEVEADVESELLYPVLRGREVRRWQAPPSASILFVQDSERRRGIDEDNMREMFPRSYEYLRQFEAILRSRAAFRRYFTRHKQGHAVETGPFYSMFNVGQYTLAEHKVVWHRMITPIEAAVVGTIDGKPVLPQETHCFVACDTADEAFYLAGLLNSTVFNLAAMTYSQAGSKSFGAPHLLRTLHLPRFDPADEQHRRVVDVARESRAGKGTSQRQLDSAAAAIWNVNKSELADVTRAMRQLTKVDLEPNE